MRLFLQMDAYKINVAILLRVSLRLVVFTTLLIVSVKQTLRATNLGIVAISSPLLGPNIQRINQMCTAIYRNIQ